MLFSDHIKPFNIKKESSLHPASQHKILHRRTKTGCRGLLEDTLCPVCLFMSRVQYTVHVYAVTGACH